MKVCIGWNWSAMANLFQKKETDELTAILASGRKSAMDTSNIKLQTSYIPS